MARVISGIVLAAIFFAMLVRALMNEAQVECEVCIAFEGREACRTSIASSRERAISGAVTNACAVLSSGVTAGIQCSNTPPSSLSCRD